MFHVVNIIYCQQTQQWSPYPNQPHQITNLTLTQGIQPHQSTPNNWFVPNQTATPAPNQQPTQGLYDNRPTSQSPNVIFSPNLQQQQPSHPPIQHPNNPYLQPTKPSVPFQQQQHQQHQPPLGNAVMAGEPEQFRASALFDNTTSTGNTDGWEDEWGWADNSNNNSFNISSQGPPPSASNSNANLQGPPTLPPRQQAQQPIYQHPQQSVQSQPPQVQQHPFQQQTQLPLPQNQQQQQFPPPAHRPQQPNPPPLQQQQPNFQPHPANQTQDFFNREYQSNQQNVSQPIFQQPQIPPPAQSPFVPYNNTQPPQNNTSFADSFHANASNWDWHHPASNATILNPLADTPSTLLETAPAQFATIGQAASEKYNSRPVTESGIPASTYDNHSQPDDPTNTQTAGARSAVSASGNQLTPQWSIESQVSQTSSDLSLDTRSSLTNTSEEHPYQQKFPPKPFPYNGPEVIHHQQQQQQPTEEVDLLEQTLQSLNDENQGTNNNHSNIAESAQPYWQPQQSYQFNLNPREHVSLPNINEGNEQTAFAPEQVFATSKSPNNPTEAHESVVQHSTPSSTFAPQPYAPPTVASPANPSSFINPYPVVERSQSPFGSVPPPANALAFKPPPSMPPRGAVQKDSTESIVQQPQIYTSSAPNIISPSSGPLLAPTQTTASSFIAPPRNDSTDSFAQQPQSSAVPPPTFAQNVMPPASVPPSAPFVAVPPQSFIPPPSMPPRTQSPLVSAPSQPPLVQPPPPSQSPYDSSSSNIASVGLPPPTQFQIPPSQPPQPGAAGNPFKRTGAALHKTIQFQNTPPLSAPMLVNQVLQPSPPAANDEELLQPENSEILSDAPHNDRNQYLQTGHLSEEPTFSAPESNHQLTADPNDYLPPPGLSRFVLGQPEVSIANTQLEPPPGLDRMVPGIDLSNSTQLNLERQADGQDTVTPSVPIIRSTNVGSFNNTSTTPVASLPISTHQEPLQNTDRNLYLVLGDESDSGQAGSGQRVVDGRNTSDEPLVVSQPLIGSSEQRELVMDGENLEDDAIRGRDEPLEGANLLDGPTQPVPTVEPIQHDVPQIAAPKKFNDGSLAGSTGNDESDRERNNYFNRTAPRRSDEPPRRREKPAADQRYDTEDTDYYSDRDRERKRFGREGSARRTLENKDRFDRDREAGRNRGEAGRSAPQTSRSDKYRDERGNVSRRDGDRYEKDRYRYETDGSRYDPEDSRYNRQPRRRGEEDVDRKYRRGERGSDGRRRGEFFFVYKLLKL